MAIAFSYVESTNMVVVTGGTSGIPATFADFVHADRTVNTAATVMGSGAQLMAATAVGDPTTLPLTYQVRPVEFKALHLTISTIQAGGAAVSGDEQAVIDGTTAVWCNLTGASANGQSIVPCVDKTHLFQVGQTVILIDLSTPANWETDVVASIQEGVSITLTNNNTNAYATGDVVGIYQTETMDLSVAFATYISAKDFGQVAEIIYSGFDGTNTAQVEQPIWGVIWDYGNGQYRIDCLFDVGNDVNATYFQSINELICFADGMWFKIENYGTLELGDASGDWSKNGSCWSMKLEAYQEFVADGDTNSVFKTYGSMLIRRSGDSQAHVHRAGSWIARNFIYSGARADGSDLKLYSTEVDWVDVKVLYMDYFQIFATPTAFSNVHVHDSFIPLQLAAACTVPELNITDSGFADLYSSVAADCVLTNPKFDIATVFITKAVGTIAEQYTCNVHVADKDGADLASALIDCEYANLVLGSDNKTYKCIADHTAVDADHKPITGTDWAGYWELYSDAETFIKPGWETGFDYKSGTQEFAQQTADANGDMTEQDIQYKKWVGTTEYEEQRIHKFTLSKAGYETLILEAVTVDGAIDWHLELQQQKQSPAPWQEGVM